MSDAVTSSSPKGVMSNATWNSFATIWTIAIGFIVTPVLIHNLGVAQYGLLLLVWSLTGVLGIMRFGLVEATLRYVARYHGENNLQGINRVFSSTLSIYVLIAALVLVVVFSSAAAITSWLGLSAGDHRQFEWLLRVAALTFAIGLIGNALGAIPPALQRYDIASKISISMSVLRSSGYAVFALSGAGLLHLLFWDLLVNCITLLLLTIQARRLLPKLSLLPAFSLGGLKEIAGYSVFSFLTYAVHTMHRESGKLLLVKFVGPAPIAYLGTPDNLGQKIHNVIASGSEALLPRFSAERNQHHAQSLFWNSTWAALSVSLILFIPFFVLVPDFLGLWISAEFARQSGLIGQLLALYLISQSAFAPVAAFFRGVGKPWYVTMVIFFSLVVTVLASLHLMPSHGVYGVAYGYLAGSAAPLMGVVMGGFYAFGRSAVPGMLRMVAVPALSGALACWICVAVRGHFGELTWSSFVALAAGFGALTSLTVIGADWMLAGQDAPSKQFLRRVANARKVSFIFRVLRLKRAG